MESLYPPLRNLSPQSPRQLPPFLRRFPMPSGLWSFVLFFAILPAVFIPIAFSINSQKSPLSGRATGTIVQVERFRQGFGSANNANQQLTDSLFVKYRFVVNGRPVTGALSQHSTFSFGSENLRVGQPIQVGFDPKNPLSNRPASEIPSNPPSDLSELLPFFLFFPLIALFFAGPLLLPQLRDWLRVRKLVARGNLAQGRVVWVKSPALAYFNFPGAAQQLEVEFEDETGQKQLVSGSCSNYWLLAHLPPDSPVVVAYDPKKPGKRAVIVEAYVV